jgi:hypothetical protein
VGGTLTSFFFLLVGTAGRGTRPGRIGLDVSP